MSTTNAAISLERPSLTRDWSLRSWSLYVLLPVLIFAVVLAARYAGGEVTYWVLESPVGVRESLTGALAFVAGIVSLVAFFQPSIRHNWKVRTWLLLFFIGMIYFVGEDLNWGQYYFGWVAPEFFQAHNREHETNLHNMSPWFNQKPRLVVELWLLITCIAVPVGWRLPQRLTAKFLPATFWPDARLVLIAGMALLIKVPDWLAGHSIGPAIRWSEVQELYFAYAWLLYAFLLLARCGPPSKGSSPGGTIFPSRSGVWG
ncbi:MAG: hypothetical protein ACRECX_07565 [Methyloceanibacter sp.]|uniref:hypothetical protein n=1 Tax=Methyloceanibacter sp. TaxID=1965321 RepID=UPI003D6D662A